MEKVNFFKVNELKAKKVLEDSTLRVVTNKNTMVTFFEFGPNTIPLEPNTKVMDVFYPIREDYL
jgi:hypothetical protein